MNAFASGARNGHCGHPCASLGTLLQPVAGARGGRRQVAAIDPALVALAGRHHLVPGLAAALRGTDTAPEDAELADYFAAIHALNARRNARLLDEAREIAAALAQAGVRALFLKGTALLLRGDYADPAARFIGDIDILPADGAVEAAAASLQAIGFRRLPDGKPGAHDRVKLTREERPAQVELHAPAVPRHLVAALPTRALHRHAEALPSALLVPCATDLVIHNVAHAMLHDRNFQMAELPLRDALDLALLAGVGGVDWDAVEDRLARVGLGRSALAFYLSATAAAFPWARLPRPALTAFGAQSLRAWQSRRGRPTGRVRRRFFNLVEHSEAAVRGLRRAVAGREVRP